MRSLILAFGWLALAFNFSSYAQEEAGLAKPTLEDFLGPIDFWSPELSPSGQYLAGVRREGEGEYLITLDLNDEASTPKGMAMGDSYVRWTEWVTDDRLLMSVMSYFDIRTGDMLSRDDMKDLPSRAIPFAVTRIMAMDRDGGNVVILFGDDRRMNRNFNLGRVVSFLRDDPDHVLISAYRGGDLDLFKVSVVDGSFERIALGTDNTYSWYVDRKGEPAFRFNTNRRGSIIYIYAREDRANGKIKWRKVKTIRLNRNRRDESATEFRPISAGPTETTYYVAARPEGEDRTGIYLYDFEKDEFVETVRTHDRLDIENAIFNRTTKELQGVYYQDDRLVIEYEDPEVQSHMNGLQAYFGENQNVIPMMSSKDGKVWLVFANGPGDSGSYHIYDVEKTFARELGANKSALSGKMLGDATIISYTARDGLELRGYLTRPRDLAEGEIPPLIVRPHGGPEARDTLSFSYDVQVLVAAGYQVFQPNFRGSSGYGKAFADKGRRQWGKAMQTDLDDGFAHLVEAGLADANNACIMGASYGGYASLAAVTLTPDQYQCAIAIAAPSDLREMLKWERKEEGRDSESYKYWREHIGDPRKDKDAIDAVSPAHLADRVQVPVLLIHGDKDGVVPVEQFEIMEKALKKADKDFDTLRMEEAGHSYRSDEDERREYLKILEFLGEHLPVATN
jgi:dipeptidyl aminopeptidase/acylaminoacyl peptidase